MKWAWKFDSAEELVEYCMRDKDWTEKVGKPFFFTRWFKTEKKNHSGTCQKLARGGEVDNRGGSQFFWAVQKGGLWQKYQEKREGHKE